MLPTSNTNKPITPSDSQFKLSRSKNKIVSLSIANPMFARMRLADSVTLDAIPTTSTTTTLTTTTSTTTI